MISRFSQWLSILIIIFNRLVYKNIYQITSTDQSQFIRIFLEYLYIYLRKNNMFRNLETETKAFINRVQISLNPNQFIEDSSKIDHKDVYQIKAIILKILIKILPPEAIFEPNSQVIKVEFVGKSNQTLPKGNQKRFEGKVYLYKIVGQVITKNEAWDEKISEFYFNCDTFNLFTPVDGNITKQINIQNGTQNKLIKLLKYNKKVKKNQILQNNIKPQIPFTQFSNQNTQTQNRVNQNMNNFDLQQTTNFQIPQNQNMFLPQNTQSINTPQNFQIFQIPPTQMYRNFQQVYQPYQSQKKQAQKPKNRKQYIKTKLQNEVKQRNWGYNQISFHQKQQNMNLNQDTGLLQQLYHTLTKIGIIVELKINTLQRKFKLSGQVQMIRPNRSIKQTELKDEQVIRIQDSDYLIYYFSNPQLLPIFIKGTVPTQIIQYNRMINQKMQELRKNQTQNIYNKQYNVLTKEFISGTKIYVYEGYVERNGVAQVLKWLKNAGFDVTYQMSQTAKLRTQIYDIIWISSSNMNTLSDKDVDYIVQQYKQGVGLFLWGDNDFYYIEVNKILAKIISPEYQLVGNYHGAKLLRASTEMNIGTFDLNHPVSSGFATLYQGVTICHPTISHPDIEVFAYNTNPQKKQQSLVYRKPKQNEGYLWIDNGFTKYIRYGPQFSKYEKEVQQYVINVCCTIMKKKKI